MVLSNIKFQQNYIISEYSEILNIVPIQSTFSTPINRSGQKCYFDHHPFQVTNFPDLSFFFMLIAILKLIGVDQL